MKTFRDNEYTDKYLTLIKRTDPKYSQMSDSAIIKHAITMLAYQECEKLDNELKIDKYDDKSYSTLCRSIREQEIKSLLN